MTSTFANGFYSVVQGKLIQFADIRDALEFLANMFGNNLRYSSINSACSVLSAILQTEAVYEGHLSDQATHAQFSYRMYR